MIVATHKCGCPVKGGQPKKNVPCPPCCFSQPKRSSKCCLPKCFPQPRQQVKCTRTPKFCPMKLRVAKSNCVTFPPCYPPPCNPPPCPPPPCPPSKQTSKNQCICKPRPCFSKPNKSKKIVSEIVDDLPYKEIEAIINNNRMVIRMQKDPRKDLYDPPCDCDSPHNPAGPSPSEHESAKGSRENNNDVVIEMTDTSRAKAGAQKSTVQNTCDQSGTGGHTVTLYPAYKPEEEPETDTNHQPALPRLIKDKKDDKPDPAQQRRPIDFEENPNIFVLRIRKKSGNGDNKQRFDVEFRTPRPWSQKKIKEMTEFPLKKSESDTETDAEQEKGAELGKKASKKNKKKKKKKK